ncbi:uncharacterized membrane protein (UPF0136 family) [Methanomicrobium sp. W14]|uniref:hypothetical protein n=1 Tax=Methanomicrobium sp. W14 TaxID=2817839 RepID=UPI001AE27560|nr:hypothetical protein [Methanomicrobium sp. W14]MBP2132403.1 uncharacterized membrane protein (UPF0136 family) [Methanomicrobium sp. W14]
MNYTNIFIDGSLDCILDSLILTCIVFAAFSVLVYLVLTRIKDEKIQLVSGVVAGFVLIALSAFTGRGILGPALAAVGTSLVMVSPVVAFRDYLNKKFVLPAVFLVALTYPVYFITTQYLCDFYYPYLRVLGDFIGPLILSTSATSLLVFVQRFYDSFKTDKRALFLLLLLIPGIILFLLPVAAASLSVMVLMTVNEINKGARKISGPKVFAVMIAAAFFVFLPLPFLAAIPCITSLFPLWILTAIAVSLVSAAVIYILKPKISEKYAEGSVFVLGFFISAALVYLTMVLS